MCAMTAGMKPSLIPAISRKICMHFPLPSRPVAACVFCPTRVTNVLTTTVLNPWHTPATSDGARSASITTTTILRGMFNETYSHDSSDMLCDWESRLRFTLERPTRIRRAYSKPKFLRTTKYVSGFFRSGARPHRSRAMGRRSHRYTFIVSPTLQNSGSAYWIISPTCTSALPVCFSSI